MRLDRQLAAACRHRPVENRCRADTSRPIENRCRADTSRRSFGPSHPGKPASGPAREPLRDFSSESINRAFVDEVMRTPGIACLRIASSASTFFERNGSPNPRKPICLRGMSVRLSATRRTSTRDIVGFRRSRGICLRGHPTQAYVTCPTSAEQVNVSPVCRNRRLLWPKR